MRNFKIPFGFIKKQQQKDMLLNRSFGGGQHSGHLLLFPAQILCATTPLQVFLL